MEFCFLKRLTIVILLINISICPSYILIYNRSFFSKKNVCVGEISAYTNIINYPIFIDDTSPISNWNNTVSQNNWCTGKGMFSEPYLIQNIKITFLDFDCITIQNSNAYFTIRNCTILGSQKDSGSGILLKNVNNSHIMYSSISSSNYYGINLDRCSKVYLYQNTINQNGGIGISLDQCVDCEILSTNAYNNSIAGISLFRSNNTKIIDNEIYLNHTFGIFGEQSIRTDIRRNNIYSNKEGIHLLKSNVSTVSQNTITNNFYNGIRLILCQENEINDNIIETNHEVGINLEESYENIITYNSISNHLVGIRFFKGTGNTETDNIFTNNSKNIIHERFPGKKSVFLSKYVPLICFIIIVVVIFLLILYFARETKEIKRYSKISNLY